MFISLVEVRNMIVDTSKPNKLRNVHYKKVHVGNDQEKVQSERSSHSKNRGGKKTKLTIRNFY